MKKFLNLTVWLIIVCTFYWACKKDQTTSNNKNLTTEEQQLIANAKTYFESNVQNTIQGKHLSDVTDTAPGQFNPLRSLLKSADWSNAYTLKLSIGKIVVAPIKFSDSLYARPANTDSTTRLSINNLVKLILYKDSAKQLHVEVVTAFPDSNFLNNPTGSFSGIAFVQDWQGNFLKSYQYKNGQINELAFSDSLQSSNVATDAIARPNLIAPPPGGDGDGGCTITDWYTCIQIGDASNVCTFTHTTSTGCEITGGGGGDGGGIGSAGYGGVAGGVAGGGSGSAYSLGPAHLCGSYNWGSIGVGWYTQFNNLGFSLVNTDGSILTFYFANPCIQFSQNGVPTKSQADDEFNSAWNYAVDQIENDANNKAILGDLAVKTNMKKYLQSYLKTNFGASATFNTSGGCAGAPYSTAHFCPQNLKDE